MCNVKLQGMHGYSFKIKRRKKLFKKEKGYFMPVLCLIIYHDIS